MIWKDQNLQNSLFPVSDTNECLTDPCLNGECTNEPGSFNCACDAGYEGELCDQGKDFIILSYEGKLCDQDEDFIILSYEGKLCDQGEDFIILSYEGELWDQVRTFLSYLIKGNYVIR